MKTYLVGGAVRDRLLGVPVYDKDWVVVGATPQQLLAAGYKPVGKDFPVFLHPQTNEEVALARTERKTNKGYAGFVFYTDPSVTLEEDLARRDLTINAIAQSSSGELIDPYGGQADLEKKILRHVTLAFAEDPVRILRVARFAARYKDFSIAPETMVLMQEMVQAGEADALVAERVWQELAKGLVENKPSRMFETLQYCGALEHVLPELNLNSEFLEMLDHAKEQGLSWDADAQLCIQFAFFAYALTTNLDLKGFCERLRVPSECKELLTLTRKEFDLIYQSLSMTEVEVMALFRRCDAIRQPLRFGNLISVQSVCAIVRQDMGMQEVQRQKERLLKALEVVLSVKTAPITQQAMQAGKTGKEVGEVVEAARLDTLHQFWRSSL